MDRTLTTIIVLALLYALRDQLPLPLFRMPGDILYHSERFHLFLPFTTCILISFVISILTALLNRQ